MTITQHIHILNHYSYFKGFKSVQVTGLLQTNGNDNRFVFMWNFFFSGGDGVVYHLKVLVPCVAAGAIIGKGGETIAQLQKDTGARMKMSKANDFYPCEFSCLR